MLEKKHLLRNIYPGKYIRTEVITLKALIPSIIDCLDRNGAGCKKRSEDTGLKEGTQAREEVSELSYSGKRKGTNSLVRRGENLTSESSCVLWYLSLSAQ